MLNKTEQAELQILHRKDHHTSKDTERFNFLIDKSYSVARTLDKRPGYETAGKNREIILQTANTWKRINLKWGK